MIQVQGDMANGAAVLWRSRDNHVGGGIQGSRRLYSVRRCSKRCSR